MLGRLFACIWVNVGREFSPFSKGKLCRNFLKFLFNICDQVYTISNKRLSCFCIGTMARTRRSRVRTPCPSSSEERTPSPEESPVEESPSPESPPRSRHKTVSTSRDEPFLDYDTTRFTSLENQQWYETGLNKEIIIEKYLAPEMDDHYKVSMAFKRLG